MSKTNTNIPEAVRGFFEDEDFMRHISQFAYDKDSQEHIRSYAAGRDIACLPVDRFACIERIEPNTAIMELLENALDSWIDSDESKRDSDSAVCRYFCEIEWLLSAKGMSDMGIAKRIRGERHLALIIKLLNRRFTDPNSSEKWMSALPNCFTDSGIAKLFFVYALDLVLPGRGARRGAEKIELEENFLRCLCDAGLVFIYKPVYDNVDPMERMALDYTIHNFCELVIWKGYYRDDNEVSRENFDEVIKLFLLTGLHPDTKELIATADELLMKLALSAWTRMFERNEVVVAGQYVADRMAAALALLKRIPLEEVGCCQDEWAEMINMIGYEHTIAF